jgi:hypothetical protein
MKLVLIAFLFRRGPGDGEPVRRWRRVAVIGAVAVLAGLGVAQRTNRAEAVLAAVLLYQLGQFAEPDGSLPPVCVEIVDPRGAGDPGSRLLRRMRRVADVRRISECSVAGQRPTLSSTGEAAVVLGAGPIEWTGPDEARVRARYVSSPTSFARPVYRVVLERRRWVCLGPIIEGTPL